MTVASPPPRFDSIGHGYARTRREEPRFAAVIAAALGDARTVVNVGAGAGSYEPRDRHVDAHDAGLRLVVNLPEQGVASDRQAAGRR